MPEAQLVLVPAFCHSIAMGIANAVIYWSVDSSTISDCAPLSTYVMITAIATLLAVPLLCCKETHAHTRRSSRMRCDLTSMHVCRVCVWYSDRCDVFGSRSTVVVRGESTF